MIYTVPDPPEITVDSTTATSITISGGVPSDSVADSYEVMWVTNDVGGCSGGSDMNRTTRSPSDNANGYIITYTTGDISNIVNIDSGSTDETILIDLMKEAEYIISIVATSQHFYSDSVMANTVQLGKDRTSLFSDVLHLTLSLSALFLSVSLPDEPVVEMEYILQLSLVE